jgi:hypothetical protein
VSGDAGAHGSGAQDGDTFDLRARFHDVGRQLLRIQAPGRLASVAGVSVTERTKAVNRRVRRIPKSLYIV